MIIERIHLTVERYGWDRKDGHHVQLRLTVEIPGREPCQRVMIVEQDDLVRRYDRYTGILVEEMRKTLLNADEAARTEEPS